MFRRLLPTRQLSARYHTTLVCSCRCCCWQRVDYGSFYSRTPIHI